MATYFAGGGADSLTPGTGSVSFSGGTVLLNGSTAALGTAEAFAFVVDPADGQRKGVQKLWTHVNISMPGPPPTTYGALQWFNSAGTLVLDLVPSGAPWLVRFWNGSAFVEVGSVTVGQSFNLDVYIRVHAVLGEISLYHNGGLIFRANNIDTSGMVDVAKLRMKAVVIGASNNTAMSSVLLASYNTIGHQVRRRVPSSDATLEWSGSYTSVDGSSAGDTDAISTDDIGSTALFGAAGLSETPPGSVIKSVVVAARIRAEGELAPTSAKAVIEVGGQAYVAPTSLVVGPGFDGAMTCYDLDPSTGSLWSSIAAANGNFGLVSGE